MEEGKLIAKNSKGEIVVFNSYENTINCSSSDLIEIISIPQNIAGLYCCNNQLISLPELPIKLIILMCDMNNIKQLPNLRYLNNLQWIYCDIQCFENYMLDMYDNQFTFFC